MNYSEIALKALYFQITHKNTTPEFWKKFNILKQLRMAEHMVAWRAGHLQAVCFWFYGLWLRL